MSLSSYEFTIIFFCLNVSRNDSHTEWRDKRKFFPVFKPRSDNFLCYFAALLLPWTLKLSNFYCYRKQSWFIPVKQITSNEGRGKEPNVRSWVIWETYWILLQLIISSYYDRVAVLLLFPRGARVPLCEVWGVPTGHCRFWTTELSLIR
jgi:hypothetical protein